MAKKTIKGRKKKWIEIIAPKMFNNAVIGEVPVYETETVMGKTATVNLMTLTNDMKKQNYNVSFEVNEIVGEKAHTRLIKYEILSSLLKRMVRRGKEKVDLSFKATTKDGQTVLLKPLIITRRKTSKPVLSSILQDAEKRIKLYANKINYDALAQDIIFGGLGKKIKIPLCKIYPVRSVDVRVMKLMGKGNA